MFVTCGGPRVPCPTVHLPAVVVRAIVEEGDLSSQSRLDRGAGQQAGDLLGVVHFPFDSDVPEPAELNALFAALAKVGPASLVIEGHADAVGPEAYNQRLSERRADAVAKAIHRSFPATQFEIRGHGESKPVATNGSKQSQAANRRAEVSSTPEVKGDGR